MVEPQHVLAFLVVVVYPIWDYYDTRELKAGANPSAKLRYYKKTLALEWLAAIAALFVAGPRIFALTVQLPRIALLHPIITRTLAAALVIAIVYLVLGPQLRALRDEKVRRIILRQCERISFFTPRTPLEFRWFAPLCVTGGICEEILFRGFLIHYFGRNPWHLGVIAAVLISSFSFATAHLYQGVKNLPSVFIAGVLFALLFVLTGNLLVPIIVHAAMDLLAIPLLRSAPANGAASSV
jgi:membrane protease YdiL (CAAX protease family)